MSEVSTKPYLLRAIYEWCTDNGYTPHIAVVVDHRTRVPMQFVKNGEIVLNISFEATSGLKMENDQISFSARFGGVSKEIQLPVDNVIAIYARENGQGMAFEAPQPATADSGEAQEAPESVTPVLSSVPSSAPAAEPEKQGSDKDAGDGGNDDPEPPKKGGRPVLTRIK